MRVGLWARQGQWLDGQVKERTGRELGEWRFGVGLAIFGAVGVE